jgi:hypothetical protein
MVSVIRGNDNFDSSTSSSTTDGAVGSYLFATNLSTTGSLDYGATVAGSGLKGTSIYVSSATSLKSTYSFSGTWKCMGYIFSYSASSAGSTSLFVRIS